MGARLCRNHAETMPGIMPGRVCQILKNDDDLNPYIAFLLVFNAFQLVLNAFPLVCNAFLLIFKDFPSVFKAFPSVFKAFSYVIYIQQKNTVRIVSDYAGTDACRQNNISRPLNFARDITFSSRHIFPRKEKPLLGTLSRTRCFFFSGHAFRRNKSLYQES